MSKYGSEKLTAWINAAWCKGNTTDFDSVDTGSIPVAVVMAEAAEGWKFEVEVEKDGDFNRLNILDTFQ